MTDEITVESWLAKAREQLHCHGIASASLDAAVLLCHALQKPRSYLFTWPDKALTEPEYIQAQALLTRRLAGEPIAYIVGLREFWSLPLKVSPTTLIPRPDTEKLVEVALSVIKNGALSGPVLDLGTGTGAIALAIASECPSLSVTGVDVRPEAVELAQQNGLALSIHNAQFCTSHWFSELTGKKFALIVSNPPYIDENDPHLSQGDVRFEPLSALVAKDQGMADIKHIISAAKPFLLPGGGVVFEHGFEQGKLVRDFFLNQGYTDVETIQDDAGLDRVTIGFLAP
ncbi:MULTISPECIES: peptide chain release factor N(5)-glutamine methyltransferase [unclassified Vibrio]|uniref:Release factor glutamine methyltransferase n=1 Tax=Vibrio sp. HB236076 TaxID=3232307 RepID=A0AB39HF39_9VIBR|nr:peptide chain release factor N(5)-glutamine methyltransferase [Vibrio sp. HB161653]MDP5254230.1 peptide chain release factor N(5)-glutamine methyltransferase [Vibrio sp. HB161653]